MPRKRMLDPSFWSDTDIGKLSRDERLMFIGLICHSDDEGRGEASPEFLRRAIFGYDDNVTVQTVNEWLEEIAKQVRGLVLYEDCGRRYYFLASWRRYQRVSHPTPSVLPCPPSDFVGVPSRVQVQLDPAYGKMITSWEQAVGILNTAHVIELDNLVKDWEEHVKKLPAGHKNLEIAAAFAVESAIQETVTHADRPTLAYVKAVLQNWMKDGFRAPKPGKKKVSLPEAKAGLSKEEVKMAKEKKNVR